MSDPKTFRVQADWYGPGWFREIDEVVEASDAVEAMEHAWPSGYRHGFLTHGTIKIAEIPRAETTP